MKLNRPIAVSAWTVAFLLGCLPASFGQAAEPAAKIVGLRGRVDVSASPWVPARLDQLLYQGNRLRTHPRSRAVLLLNDDTHFKVDADTELTLRSAAASAGLISRISRAISRSGQTVLDLLRGRIYLRSRKRPAQLEIKTPAVTAAIRGTEFDLRVEADGESVLTVLEGAVDFRNPLGAIVVNSGEQGLARVGQAPTKTVLVNPEDAVQWSLTYTAAVSGRDYPFREDSPERARQALAEAPDSPLIAAQLQFDAGDMPAALESIEGLDSPEAAQVRGWVFLQQNRVTEAMAEFQAAPSDSPRTRLGLSLAHFRLNQLEEAYLVVEEPGRFPRLQVQKAALLLLYGAPGEARRLLEPVPPDSPVYSLARGLLSNVFLVQNRKEEAFDAALEAVRNAPNSPSAHLNLSLAYQSRFELEAAIGAARAALELDPHSLPAQVQLAKLLFGSGRSDQAERIMREALRQAPQEAEVEVVLGFIVLARGKTEQARRFFESARSRDSTLAECALGLGLVAMRRGEIREAAAEILAAAALEPRRSLYQSYLAKAFYELRQFESAFRALAAARELDPQDPTPFLYEGIFLDDRRRPGEAVLRFQESIRRNDNRAVYRSRFLLDQDRAARNVNLARAYNRLGLSEWGNLEALKSNLADPANSSAHLFLANTFLKLPDRIQAAGSELLLARLLMPVNANSFNTFNDYTTLFELPRLFSTSEGGYGSFDSSNARLISSGGGQRFTQSSIFQFDQTRGFRSRNDDAESYSMVSLFKFALTPESELLLSYSNQQNRRGGLAATVRVNDQNDPDLRGFTRVQRAEAGYHRRLRPGSELVLLFSARTQEQVIDDPDRLRRFGIDIQLRRSSREPSLSLQGLHIWKLENVQLRYGFDVFEGRLRTRDVFVFTPPGQEEFTSQEFDLSRRKVRFKTLFFRADYPVDPRLVLTAGLNYDWANDDHPLDSTQRPTSRWNPQAGILFSPLPSTTLRFAFSQNLRTHLQERIIPAHLYGFTLAQNEPELVHSTAYQLGWDQHLGRRTFLRSLVFWRDRAIPALGKGSEAVLFDGNFYGGRVTLNHFLTERLTLVPEYALTHSHGPNLQRHDHELSLGLFYVHPAGVFVEARERFFRQTGHRGLGQRKTKVFTTDFKLSYEMPEKFGRIFLEVNNLFDRRFEFFKDLLDTDFRLPKREWKAGLEFNF